MATCPMCGGLERKGHVCREVNHTAGEPQRLETGPIRLNIGPHKVEVAVAVFRSWSSKREPVILFVFSDGAGNEIGRYPLTARRMLGLKEDGGD